MGSQTDMHLVRGLIGAGEHLHLYTTNASFKASIDTLAALLPMWVEGLAVRSIADEAKRQQMIRDLRYTPPSVMLTPEQAKAFGLDK